MGQTKLTSEERISSVQDEIFDHVYPRIQVLEKQIQELQQLVLTLKMCPPIQVINPSYPPPSVPYNPLPGYPFPYVISYGVNSSSGKTP